MSGAGVPVQNAANTTQDAALAAFLQHPENYLDTVARQAPSREALGRLAGSIATTVVQQCTDNPPVCARYLQAAAAHVASSGSATAAVHAGLPAAAVASLAAEAESKQEKHLAQVLEAIGHAVTYCTPRTLVAQSGILSALQRLVTADPHTLTAAHVEFLQACCFAQHYRYAARTVQSTWPRPVSSSLSVRLVLRYYYLRGTVFMALQDWPAATRALQTCLVVPAETAVSAIVLAAWKKLVLVQCLAQSAEETLDPLHVPRSTPGCVTRFLTQAMAASTSSSSSTTTSSIRRAPARQQEEEMAAPEAMHVVEVDQEANPEQQVAVTGKDPTLGVKVYSDLVQAFVKMDRAGLQNLLVKQAALFESDGNMGLARQCETELTRRQVYQASRMYAVLSLQDLSHMLGHTKEQTKDLLLQLSMERAWDIQIRPDAHVVFPPLRPLTEAVDLQEVHALCQRVQQLDVAISTSQKYSSLKKSSSSLAEAPDATAPRGVEDV